MGIRLPVRLKLMLSHFAMVVLVSGSVGTFFYFRTAQFLKDSLQLRLQNSAALVSQSFEVKDLETLDDPSDQSDPRYQHYLSLLRAFCHSNPDIAYLYIMRRQGDRVFFVVDSDETPAQALPGQEYQSVTPTLMLGFSQPSVNETFYTDQWGEFLSGFAPLPDGRGVYLVGIDMRAANVENHLDPIRLTGILSVVASIVLAFFFSHRLSQHFLTPLSLLAERCRMIMEGRIPKTLNWQSGDELDTLIDAFNAMSAEVTRSREALQATNIALEGKVEERTRELVELTRQLFEEIQERQEAERSLRQLALLDPLTGLMNRRAILEKLEEEIQRYHRIGSSFTLLLADIDHFKQVNDQYGHEVGDQVLKTVAAILRNSLRTQDLISRWGGEELLIVLPDTDPPGGLVVGQKILARLNAFNWADLTLQEAITLSIGVSTYQADQSLPELIQFADLAMYSAKRQGRNCVMLSTPNALV